MPPTPTRSPPTPTHARVGRKGHDDVAVASVDLRPTVKALRTCRRQPCRGCDAARALWRLVHFLRHPRPTLLRARTPTEGCHGGARSRPGSHSQIHTRRTCSPSLAQREQLHVQQIRATTSCARERSRAGGYTQRPLAHCPHQAASTATMSCRPASISVRPPRLAAPQEAVPLTHYPVVHDWGSFHGHGQLEVSQRSAHTLNTHSGSGKPLREPPPLSPMASGPQADGRGERYPWPPHRRSLWPVRGRTCWRSPASCWLLTSR